MQEPTRAIKISQLTAHANDSIMIKVVLQSVGTSLSAVFLGFLYSVLIARMLGPEARGIVATLVMFATLIAGLSQLGLAQGYVYHKRKFQASGKYSSEAIASGKALIIKSICLVLVASSVLGATTFYWFMPNEITHYLVCWTLLTFIMSLHLYLQNSSHIDASLSHYNIGRLAIPIINISVIAIIVLYQGVSVVSVIVASIIAYTVASLLLAKPLFKTENKHTANTHEQNKLANNNTMLTLASIRRYSASIYGTSVTGVLIQSADKIVLLIVGTMTDFGIYAVAYGLSRLVGIIPDTISTYLFAAFAGTGEKRAASHTNKVFSLLFMPLIVLGACISILAPTLIPAIFGHSYSLAVIPFIFLLFECIFSSMSWLLAQRFNAEGRPGLVLIRQLVSLIPLLAALIIMTLGVDSFNAIFDSTTANSIIQSPLYLLCIAMLASALLRLLITLAMYHWALGEKLPRMLPEIRDMITLKHYVLNRT